MEKQTWRTESTHRPWPLPAGPWTMTQQWHDLLFAHWPIPAQAMAAWIPPALALDTYDGVAWVAVVPFRMADVRPRGLPAVPWLSSFPELNVRTYVTSRNPADPRPGVFFFSLEAANPVAVAIARRVFMLPYFNAEMACRRQGDAILYNSRRTHGGAAPAHFAGQYRPTGPVTLARAGTLEHWLTERYCLYTTDRHGRPYRAEINHVPWPLQPAEAEIRVNDITGASGMGLPDVAPHLLFARRLDVVVWPLRPVRA